MSACWLGPADALAASRYISPSGSDGGACSSAGSPCRSFAYAYRQAGAGDVVNVAAGSYPDQSVPKVAGRSAPAVEFRPDGGGVSLSDLDIHGDFVSVRGVTAPAIDIDDGAGVRGVTVINSRAQRLWIENAHDVLYLGGSYGGNKDAPTLQISGNPASSNLTFDGVDFHDAEATNSSVHLECIWAGGVQGFTVRNSIFRNCAYFDIFFTTLNGPDPKNVLLENNVFEAPKQSNGQDAPYAINVANWLSRAENFTIRNNTFGADVLIQPSSIENVKLIGNLGPIASCKSGVAYSHNVFSKAKCSSTDKRVSGAMSQFVNPAGHDWHLRAGAAAIDAANPGDHPATDREGLRRAGPPDAGAHEFGGLPPGGGAPPPPTRRLEKKRKRLLAVGVRRGRICKRPRGGCRRVTALRVKLSRKATLTVKVQRRAVRRWKTVTRIHKTVAAGKRVFTIDAKRLRRGRYRIVVKARSVKGNAKSTRRIRLLVR